MKILGIIPARYGSTRLNGKTLLNIHGKTMIRRVYEQASKAQSLSELWVATDSKTIEEECKKHSIPCIMTSENHNNGTERCAEAFQKLNKPFDIIVNIQGDEPFINPLSIENLLEIFQNQPQAEIGTLKKEINSLDSLENPNIIKLVTNSENKALYFSRGPIPHVRDIKESKWLDRYPLYKHIGLYAYRTKTLVQIVKLEESDLETKEKLEQLRWLENGYSIYVAETEYESKSIDTIEDYNFIIQNFQKYNND